jgi:hypothetical protein
MMAQFAGVLQADEQTIAQLELERDIAAQGPEIAPEKIVNFYYEDLGDSTEQILRYAFWLADVKENITKSRYQEIVREQGWKNEHKKYLKVAATFKNFDPAVLRHIEPDTIFLLAKNNKKYQPVIQQLQRTAEAIDQATVRELIKKHRKSKPFKSEPTIWRATRTGEKYCQVPPIWEDDYFSGVTLQAMMNREGLTAQAIIRESLELRLAYKEGRLVEVQQPMVEEPFLDDFADYESYEAVDEVQPEIEEAFMDELEIADNNHTQSGGVGFAPAKDVPRWQLGWSEGASVVATSLVSHFEQWCGGQTVKVVSVRGKVGTIQFVTVVREDGETYDSFGDWIAPSPEKANVPQVNVGDKVIWTSCPPQFTSWEPFLIVDISGEKAKLDIVEKPVPLADLVRV